MSYFPDSLRINLGIYIDRAIEWLMENFGGFFDAVSAGIIWFLRQIEIIMFFVPWWAVLIIVFLLTWKVINTKAAFVYTIMILLVGCFGLWESMVLTLAIVLSSVVFSMVIGIPLGILMAASNRFNAYTRPVLDAMQTMPSFVYLIPAVLLFSMGKVPAVFATLVYAIPPVMRLTDLGIRNVPREMIEAAHSFGSSSWQTLLKVQLPQALPTIMTGINQTIMMALSMVVVASMIGARGLGLDVLQAIQHLDVGQGFEAGICIVFLAIIIDRLTQSIGGKFKYPK